MFTFPETDFQLMFVNGNPAHPSCALKHFAKERMKTERIEYLISLKPTNEEESLMVQKELLQLTKGGDSI